MNFHLSDEQHQVVAAAKGLARRHASSSHVSWEEAGRFDWDFLGDLAKHGFTGIDLPLDVGGQGQSLLDAVLVLEAVGSVAPHLADGVHVSNFGAIRQLAAFTNGRLEDMLRELLAGNGLISVAMSESDAGSAVHHLKTSATVSGSDVRISGQKIFNTNGPIATHYVVWVRFTDAADGIGAVIVPETAAGFSHGPTERFLSGETYCTLYFDDVVVPDDHILIDNQGLGRMLTVFNIERLGNATRSLALGELALQLATDHVVGRVTGGRRLADHQGLRWKLADARMQLDAARLLVYRAAAGRADGTVDPMEVSIAKCYANEAGYKTADAALQLMGGYGYTTECPIDYIWRRTRGWMIAGGSVEVIRNMIGREIIERHVAIK